MKSPSGGRTSTRLAPRQFRAASALVLLAVTLAAAAGCSSAANRTPGADVTAVPPSTAMSAEAALADAARLLDPTGTGKATPEEVACVRDRVVSNPTLDELAHNMATYTNKDLRQAVMTMYLQCAYDFVLDLYMAYAPATLTSDELACIRSQYTRLAVDRLSEVIVQDPDAGKTGPLLVAACTGHDVGDPFAGIDTIPPTP